MLDILGHLAFDLSGAQCHSQGLCHVGLNGDWDFGVPVCGSDPQIRGSRVFEFCGPKLCDVGVGDEGEDHVLRKPLFDGVLDTEGVGCVYEDAGVLWGDDGFDDGGEIVDIWESLDAEQNIVVRASSRNVCRFLRTSDDCNVLLVGRAVRPTCKDEIPDRGLNRSLPNRADL